MTAPVLVGYTATDAGRDAVRLGARLARALGTRLHLVLVLPSDGTRSAAVPKERSYEAYLRQQAQEWLREAAASVPAELTRSGHVRFAESFAEGLITAAEEFGASTIVVGAANGARFGRHHLGSVAQELLHSSPVPVALAPTATPTAEAAVSRVTAMVGTRAGADYVVEKSAELATEIGTPLRLVSLVAVDLPAGMPTDDATRLAAEHADEVLAAARAALPTDLTADVVQGTGSTVENAVTHLEWQDDEIVVVGSSRLAQPRRLFLGSTAAKMLHELPVPLIVVPRERPEGV